MYRTWVAALISAAVFLGVVGAVAAGGSAVQAQEINCFVTVTNQTPAAFSISAATANGVPFGLEDALQPGQTLTFPLPSEFASPGNYLLIGAQQARINFDGCDATVTVTPEGVPTPTPGPPTPTPTPAPPTPTATPIPPTPTPTPLPELPPEFSAVVDCVNNAGVVVVSLFSSLRNSNYLVEVGGAFNSVNVTVDSSATVQSDPLPDGDVVINVTRDGALSGSTTLPVTCANGPLPTPTAAPTPTATPSPSPTPTPTSTPVPTTTPTPVPLPASAEVRHVVSCLAGNGRMDTNVVNTSTAAADYRIEFEGLSARSATVAAGDWWRMPITGRVDGDYDVTVKRGGQVVSDLTVTIDCDSASPQVSEIEVDVLNACRFGNGYLLFQLVNPSAAQRGWVIEFDNVPNRSTSAPGYGAAVRAVTGRPDGDHDWLVRIGGQTIATGTVTVDC